MTELIPLLNNYGSLGTLIAVIILVVHSMWTTSKANNATFNIQKKVENLCVSHKIADAQINDLYAWHNQVDSDGVKIWYVRRSFEEAIEKMAENHDKQTRLLEKLFMSFEGLAKDIHNNVETLSARLISNQMHRRENDS